MMMMMMMMMRMMMRMVMMMMLMCFSDTHIHTPLRDTHMRTPQVVSSLISFAFSECVRRDMRVRVVDPNVSIFSNAIFHSFSCFTSPLAGEGLRSSQPRLAALCGSLKELLGP
jgi:hypothetical protein